MGTVTRDQVSVTGSNAWTSLSAAAFAPSKPLIISVRSKAASYTRPGMIRGGNPPLGAAWLQASEQASTRAGQPTALVPLFAAVAAKIAALENALNVSLRAAGQAAITTDG